MKQFEVRIRRIQTAEKKKGELFNNQNTATTRKNAN